MQTPFDQRGNNFDIIRMALAVLVIFSHSYPLGTGSELREPFNLLTRYQATGGHIAVDLFFIISGFLSLRVTNVPRRFGVILRSASTESIPHLLLR